MEIVTRTSRPRLYQAVAGTVAILLTVAGAASAEPDRSVKAATSARVQAVAPPPFVRFLLAPARPDREDVDLVAHKRETAAPRVQPAPPMAAPVAPVVRRKKPAKRVERALAVRTARQARPVRQRQPQYASRTARTAGTSNNQAVAYALAQVGKPYRWAAAGPGSYDCSGLVMMSYRQVGVSLPHQTGGIIRVGQPVARGQLQAGDLVFPSSGHVGIYLGGGQMVHAPKPGDHVKVSPVYAFWAARRPG